jgi:hypothetical protein
LGYVLPDGICVEPSLFALVVAIAGDSTRVPAIVFDVLGTDDGDSGFTVLVVLLVSIPGLDDVKLVHTRNALEVRIVLPVVVKDVDVSGVFMVAIDAVVSVVRTGVRVVSVSVEISVSSIQSGVVEEITVGLEFIVAASVSICPGIEQYYHAFIIAKLTVPASTI